MANLESLVEEVRATGLPVELSVAGEATQIGPGVDLAAYRIVQEALTNVRKHAGLVPPRVAVRYGRAAPSRSRSRTTPEHGRTAGRAAATASSACASASPCSAARSPQARTARAAFAYMPRCLTGASDESRDSRPRRLRANADFVFAAVLVVTGQAEAWSGQLDADRPPWPA